MRSVSNKASDTRTLAGTSPPPIVGRIDSNPAILKNGHTTRPTQALICSTVIVNADNGPLRSQYSRYSVKNQRGRVIKYGL